MTESSSSHDKAGLAKADAHDSVATCCVETEEATRARQTKPSARYRPGHGCTTEVLTRQENFVTTKGRGNKELYVRQDFSLS